MIQSIWSHHLAHQPPTAADESDRGGTHAETAGGGVAGGSVPVRGPRMLYVLGERAPGWVAQVHVPPVRSPVGMSGSDGEGRFPGDGGVAVGAVSAGPGEGGGGGGVGEGAQGRPGGVVGAGGGEGVVGGQQGGPGDGGRGAPWGESPRG